MPPLKEEGLFAKKVSRCKKGVLELEDMVQTISRELKISGLVLIKSSFEARNKGEVW
jgi:hypothetical protein